MGTDLDLTEFDTPETARNKTLGSIAALLERNNIAIDDVGKISKVRVGDHTVVTKDPKTGEITETVAPNSSIIFAPSWETGPQWPVVQPAKPITVRYTVPKTTAATPAGFKTAFIFPDIQAGFYRRTDGTLVPIHDVAAIDVALQMLAFVKPDVVIFVGDNADLAEMSKYRLSPLFQSTVQATVDYLDQLLARVRAIVGDECEIRWVEGNHELRMSVYILDNAKAAFGIRKAGAPEQWPALSIPYLCNFDHHGVQYIPGYPANRTWINNRLQVIHGTHVVSNGSTAHRYLAHERVSTIYGHIHRREWAERTKTGHDGPFTIMAMSSGCLARIDGAVPSTKGGMDLDGAPVTNVEDWQQGIGIITYQDGEGAFFPEQVAIHSGMAMLRGRLFSATVDHEGNPLA